MCSSKEDIVHNILPFNVIMIVYTRLKLTIAGSTGNYVQVHSPTLYL